MKQPEIFLIFHPAFCGELKLVAQRSLAMNAKLLLVVLWMMLTSYSIDGNAQANQALSNLNATSVNQHLVPSANNVRDLGSAGNGWRYLYLYGRVYINGTLTIHTSGFPNSNFFAGGSAGNTTLTSGSTTGLGRYTLSHLTSGDYNTA